MGRPPLSEWLMPEGKAQPQDFDRLRVLGKHSDAEVRPFGIKPSGINLTTSLYFFEI